MEKQGNLIYASNILMCEKYEPIKNYLSSSSNFFPSALTVASFEEVEGNFSMTMRYSIAFLS